MSEAEVERRAPVWTALAELFLDTEQQPSDYRRIADVLSASGYSRALLRRILDEEVAPAFAFNLFSVAGEWAGWPDDFVQERVLAGLNGRGLGRWLQKRMLRRHLEEEWSRIAEALPP